MRKGLVLIGIVCVFFFAIPVFCLSSRSSMHEKRSGEERNLENTLYLGSPHIETIVKQAQEDQPDFYLTHASDGAVSFVGTPYIDVRTTLDNKHILIYGHHIFPTSLAFSLLAHMYEKDQWNTLSNLYLKRAADEETYLFFPYCSLKVHATFEDIQKFSFDSDDEFEEWLKKIAEQADICNTDFVGKKWIQAVTLCTCSENRAGEEERTLIMFVR